MPTGQLWVFGLVLTGLPAPGQQISSALQLHPISRAELERGRPPERLVSDGAVRKRDGQLRLGTHCPVLKDSPQDDNFYQYRYVGSWSSSPRIRVALKESYNGGQYVVADTRQGCQQYLLDGRPYRCGTLVVNFDETRTTDRLGSIDFWRITPTGLVHIRKLKQQQVIPGSVVRFSADGKQVLFEDQQQRRCWAVLVP